MKGTVLSVVGIQFEKDNLTATCMRKGLLTATVFDGALVSLYIEM